MLTPTIDPAARRHDVLTASDSLAIAGATSSDALKIIARNCCRSCQVRRLESIIGLALTVSGSASSIRQAWRSSDTRVRIASDSDFAAAALAESDSTLF
jgi:hypothetical protein